MAILTKAIAGALASAVAFLSFLTLTTPISAQAIPVESVGGAPAAGGRESTDPAALEAFLDEFFGKWMAEKHIAGATVAVVQDGKLSLAKGYGYADVANHTPVDPDTAVFHAGSVSKLFTWTAVMQLVERGELDLDADVSTYLDFPIPQTFPQPITMTHLMTHTSGFAERWLESLASDSSEVIPVRDWLTSNMPPRLNPPGEVAGYSNYNAELAGYVVSRVSGEPFDEYVQEHILDPLGMAHSTMRSPVPPEVLANLSLGYTYTDGSFHEVPNYLAQPAGLPSGGLQTTSTDMARFMIAHLADGGHGDAGIPGTRILSAGTVKKMHSTAYTPDPRLLGSTYGFAEVTDNGQRTIGHEGYGPPMRSQLLLLPDQNLGVFYAVNTRDSGDLTVQHMGFQRAFFDHFYPAPNVKPIQPPPDFEARAARFAGTFRLASYPASTPDKVGDLFGAYSLQISDLGDGTLLVPLHGTDRRFVEAAPLYFREVDGPFALVFREGDQGNITHMFTDLMPQYAAIRTPWYEQAAFNLGLVLISVLLFLSALVVVPVQSIVNRRRGAETVFAAQAARWVLLVISMANIAFLVGMFVGYQPPTELHGVSTAIAALMGLTVLPALLTAAALVFLVLSWKDRYWGTGSRLYYSVVTVAAVAFIWFLAQWNLLGWRY